MPSSISSDVAARRARPRKRPAFRVARVSGVKVQTTGNSLCFDTLRVSITVLLNVRSGEYVLEVTPPGETALPVGRFEVRADVDQRLEIALPARNRLETTVTVTAPGVAAPAEVKTSVLVPAPLLTADHALHERILPRRARGTDDLLDAENCSTCEVARWPEARCSSTTEKIG
jgi:hypothetical protein